MPGRERFLEKSMEFWKRQTHPDVEMIVIGEPGLERAREIVERNGGTYTVHPNGAGQHHDVKRMHGAEQHATGDAIVIWDDDDWHGPGRVTAQLAQLDNCPLVGLDGFTVLTVSNMKFWKADGPISTKWVGAQTKGIWLGACSALTRELWDEQVVPTTLRRWGKIHAAAPLEIVIVSTMKKFGAASAPVDPHFVYVRHWSNNWDSHTVPGATKGTDWKEVEVDWVPDEDLDFYKSLSGALL